MEFGKLYEVRCLPSSVKATAKAVLGTEPLKLAVDMDSLRHMSEAVRFENCNLPAYQQQETQRKYHPELSQIIHGKHEVWKPWSVDVWRDRMVVNLYNATNLEMRRRKLTEMTCTIPWHRQMGIRIMADAETYESEKWGDDIRNLVLRYTEARPGEMDALIADFMFKGKMYQDKYRREG